VKSSQPPLCTTNDHFVRHVFKKTQNLARTRLAELSRPLNSELEPAILRNSPRHQVPHAAWLRQSKGRRYMTHSTINATVRRFMSTGTSGAARINRSAFPKSTIGTAVNQLTTRTPFASTLRPNLTAGAFPRTAGGYSLGSGRMGGARYFSHTPAAPAQVVNNVSAAIRAFWISGCRAQFDGISPAGNKRYRSITSLQEEANQKMQNAAPGSFIDFHISPTVTALSPLGVTFPFGSTLKQEMQTLNTEGLLDALSVDFSRALKDLAAVINDLKRLSSLGDLSITLEENSVLRVHFPGCDMETVERLCDEVGIRRGIVHQDPDFDASVGERMALLFPFAPTSQRSFSSPCGSLRSEMGQDYRINEIEKNPWVSSPEGYETMEDFSETESMHFASSPAYLESSSYEGLEGLYRFLEECDSYQRKT
jgi:hypothetical protein